MTAVKTILAGGTALAALAFAAPASAQYSPGYGGGGGDIIGQVIGSVIGGGSSYGSPYGGSYGGGYGSPYGGGYGSPYGGAYGSPYGGYGSPYGGSYGSPYGGSYGSPYGGGRQMAGNSQYAVGQCMGAVQQRLNSTYAAGQGTARVLGVSDVQQRSQGGMLVSGVANSGRAAAYGYNNNGQPPVDITFTCKTDASGMVSSIEVGQATAVANRNYGVPQASPYGTDYSQYGYRRY